MRKLLLTGRVRAEPMTKAEDKAKADADKAAADQPAVVAVAKAKQDADLVLASAKIIEDAKLAAAKIMEDAKLASAKIEAVKMVDDRYQKFWLPIALACISAVSGYFSYRAAIHADASRIGNAAVGKQVVEVKEALDGRLTELLEITRKSEHAKGVLEGAAIEQEKGKH